MPGPNVCLCHSNRLLSECLATALKENGHIDCHVLIPDEVFTTLPSRFGTQEIDLLLLDSTLEGDLSIRIVEQVKSLYQFCKIVLLVPEHALDRIFELAQIGGHGCLFEGAGLSDLHVAVQTVLKGEPFCSPQLAHALVAQVGRMNMKPDWPQQWDEAQLTSREREILSLIACQHLGNKQIARQLGLSLYTVKNHVHNIIEKLGVEDRHEAVQFARRRGLLVSSVAELHEVVAVRIPR